ncbi:MAG: HigA family addiction module antidote protein [Pseudomonadales bacterium]|nr:HigA family addiction module antidote protein [Pseudomonadales bacterium]
MNANTERAPTHPGALLREDILPAMGLSIAELARRLHLSRQSLHRILAKDQPVTAATALKLARLLNTTPDLWLNLQRARDLWEQRRELADELASIEPPAV